MILFQIVNFTLLMANMGSGMGSQLAAGRLLYGMGRGNALPQVVLWRHRAEAPHSAQQHYCCGSVCVCRRRRCLQFFSDRLGGGAYEIGAECLNFGAFVAFMGVNAAAFVHHLRSEKRSSVGGYVVPALGFLICGFIWVHLSNPALVLGAVWMMAGIAYGAVRTRGFRSELVTFEVPAEAE